MSAESSVEAKVPTLWDQQQLTGGFSAFEIAVGFLSLSQRVGLVYADGRTRAGGLVTHDAGILRSLACYRAGRIWQLLDRLLVRAIGR
jgi:hypothetical protein